MQPGIERASIIADRRRVQKLFLGLAVLSGIAVAAEPQAASVHDFGRLPPGGQWTHVFVFTNVLNRPLQIESVDKSCSCLVVEDWPRSVAAGKTGTVSVRLHTDSARGPLAEFVRLRFAGSEPKEMLFAVSAFVQAPVEATPEFVSLRRDPAGRTNAFAYVQITNHLETEVALTNAVSVTDRFSAKLEVLKPGRSYRLRIEAIPPFNSGNTFGTIRVSTSLPEFPRLEVTALVPAGK